MTKAFKFQWIFFAFAFMVLAIVIMCIPSSEMPDELPTGEDGQMEKFDEEKKKKLKMALVTLAVIVGALVVWLHY